MNLFQYAKQRYARHGAVKGSQELKNKLICDVIAPRSVVLELGSGAGYLSEQMRQKGNIVVELDTHNINLQTDPLPDKVKYDYVVAIEVIEHILDVNQLLNEVRKVLKPTGKVVISTPNLASLGRRLLLFCGLNPYVDNMLYPTDPGHLKHYTRTDMVYLMKKNGFKIEKLTSDVVILHPHGKLYCRWLADWFPALGRSIICVCS